MIESCDFCHEMMVKANKKLLFDSENNRVDVMATVLEAFADTMECGESRLICLPLIKLMGGDYELTGNTGETDTL